MLYEVEAMDAPEELGGKFTKIADVILKTKLHVSDFGHDRLFFRHVSQMRDRFYWPAGWAEAASDLFVDPSVPENKFSIEVENLDPNWPTDNDEAREKFIEQ